jgi:hypothetical protein
MAARKKKKAKPPPPSGPPTIHEATLASGPSGAVVKGAEIDREAAIARRLAGQDTVVCGDNIRANARVAEQIEAAVGPYEGQTPHTRAGPSSLPHFQQLSRSPAGHSFYETARPPKKARKKG